MFLSLLLLFPADQLEKVRLKVSSFDVELAGRTGCPYQSGGDYIGMLHRFFISDDQGMPPSGKQIEMTGITIFRLANGKLIEGESRDKAA